MQRLMHHVFNNPKGRQALATLVARQFFFHPEILTARQLSLRNGAGIMLSQLGIGATIDSISDMIEAGMPPLPKEEPPNE